MRAVLHAAVAAALLLAASSPARSQSSSAPQSRDSAKVQLIHQLLETTHAVDLALATSVNAHPAQKAANTRLPTIFWDRFLAEARNRRGDFEAMITDVYDHHLTTDDVRQLITFYQTPLGQKMLAWMPGIMQESTEAGRKWGARIGASVASQLVSEGVHFTP
jgi:uncharacterized protein